MKRLMVAATVLMTLAGWSGIAVADNNSSNSTSGTSSPSASSPAPTDSNGALGKPGDAAAKDKGTSGSSQPRDEGGTAGNLNSGERSGGGGATGGASGGGAGAGAGGGGR